MTQNVAVTFYLRLILSALCIFIKKVLKGAYLIILVAHTATSIVLLITAVCFKLEPNDV